MRGARAVTRYSRALTRRSRPTSADATASPILDGELLVGGFKSAIAHGRSGASVLNCAGQRLHAFLPKTRAPFDALRADGRCYDLEWEDSTEFSIDVDDLIRALTWARAQIRSGQPVVINCAQGVSRSGTAATAYLMACYDLDAATALGRVRLKRPLVQPNPHFMRFLEEAGPVIRGALRDEAPAPRPDGGSTDVSRHVSRET